MIKQYWLLMSQSQKNELMERLWLVRVSAFGEHRIFPSWSEMSLELQQKLEPYVKDKAGIP
jgi:hypothetical protein